MAKPKSSSNESDSDNYISEGTLSQKLLEETKTTSIHKQKSKTKDLNSNSKRQKNLQPKKAITSSSESSDDRETFKKLKKKRSKSQSKTEDSASDEEHVTKLAPINPVLNPKINSKIIEAASLSTKKGFLHKFITNSNNIVTNLIELNKQKLIKNEENSDDSDDEKDTSFSNILSSTQNPRSQDVSVSFMELGNKHSPIMKTSAVKHSSKKNEIISTSNIDELQELKTSGEVDEKKRKLSLIKLQHKKTLEKISSSDESSADEDSHVQNKKSKSAKNKVEEQKVNSEKISQAKQATVKNHSDSSSENSNSSENDSYTLRYLHKRKMNTKFKMNKLAEQKKKLLEYKATQVKSESSSDSDSSEAARNEIAVQKKVVEELRNKLRKNIVSSDSVSESGQEQKSVQETTVTKQKSKKLSNVSDSDNSDTKTSQLFITPVSKLDQSNESAKFGQQSSSGSESEDDRRANIDIQKQQKYIKEQKNISTTQKNIPATPSSFESNRDSKNDLIKKKTTTKSSSESGIDSEDDSEKEKCVKQKENNVNKYSSTKQTENPTTQSSSESDTSSEDNSKEEKNMLLNNINKPPSTAKKIPAVQSSSESDTDSEIDTKKKISFKEKENNKLLNNLDISPSKIQKKQKITAKQSSSESDTDSEIDTKKKISFKEKENNKLLKKINKSSRTTESNSESDNSKKYSKAEGNRNNLNKKNTVAQSSSEDDLNNKKINIKEETKNIPTHSSESDSDSCKIRKKMRKENIKKLNDNKKKALQKTSSSSSESDSDDVRKKHLTKFKSNRSPNKENGRTSSSDSSDESSKETKKKAFIKNTRENLSHFNSFENKRKSVTKKRQYEESSATSSDSDDNRKNKRIKLKTNNKKDCMKDFLISNPDLEPLNKGTTITLEDLNSEDEIWLVQVPKDLNPEMLVGQKINFEQNGKLKLKHAGHRYQYETHNKNSKICLLASKSAQNPKLTTKTISSSGTVIIHQTLKGNSVTIKHKEKTKVEFPSNLKIRHPIFGPKFQDKIDLDSSISLKLLGAENSKRKADLSMFKKKQKSLKNKKHKTEIEDNKNEIIFDLLNESKNTLQLNTEAVIKKKRKHLESCDEVDIKRVKTEELSEDDKLELDLVDSRKIKSRKYLAFEKKREKSPENSNLIKKLLGQQLSVLDKKHKKTKTKDFSNSEDTSKLSKKNKKIKQKEQNIEIEETLKKNLELKSEELPHTSKKKKKDKNKIDEQEHSIQITKKKKHKKEKPEYLSNTNKDTSMEKDKIKKEEHTEPNQSKKHKKKKEKNKHATQLDLTNFI